MKLFDLDGTLIDSNSVWLEIDRAFLARRGLQSTAEYREMVAHSIFPLAAQFTRAHFGLPESAEAIMDEWMALARVEYAERIALLPGVAEYLARTRAAGEGMILVTASQPELCRLALSNHGLEDYFSHLVFAQQLGLEKRDPAVFLHAARLGGVSPADCTVFDDSPVACASARAAGMTVVGVYDPFFAAYEQEMRSTCHRYIKSFLELLD